MKKVVKFGGSSLASARQFKKVADIIKSDKSRRYVVPSAPGKRSDKDEKVTDMLYACYDAVAEGRSYKKILEKIKSRYMDIIDGLNLNLNLDHEFEQDRGGLPGKGRTGLRCFQRRVPERYRGCQLSWDLNLWMRRK